MRRYGSLLLLLTGCTAFEGVEPGGAPAGGAPGNGGDGGEGAGVVQTCLAESPSCLVPELEAVRFCARIAVCPTLATAVTRATGIPIAEIDETGARVGFNFSACVDWLTGPLEDAHPGFAAVQSLLNCAIATSSCEKAEACMEVAPLPIDAASCDEGQCSPFGLSCGDDGCGASGVPPICSEPFAQGCEGALVTSCALERTDGMWLSAHIDCTRAGASCEFARCKTDGCAASPVNVCADSSSISLCLQGKSLEFDCASVGLSCVPEDIEAGLSGHCE